MTKLKFLSELPKNGKKINYDELINKKQEILVQYEDKNYRIAILHRNKNLKTTYRIINLDNKKEKDITASDFINGHFCDILDLISLEHIFKINDIIDTKTGKIKIIDLIYLERLNGKKSRGYKCECIAHGHTFEITETDLKEAHGCGYCTGQKVLKGFNDIWSTNPSLAKLLANSEDGYKYMQSSNQRLDWKCPKCGFIVQNKRIQDIKNYGLFCSNCSDGLSTPERIVFEILKSLNIDFEYDKAQPWSKNKRYDFLIPSMNCIIETHGAQHYLDKTFTYRTLDEEQQNDLNKIKMAKENGYNNYIVIECMNVNFEYVKNSIINNVKFCNTFDLSKINWNEIYENSLTSIKLKAIELYNTGLSVTEIANLLKLNRNTIIEYLTSGNLAGICSYTNKNDVSNNNISKTEIMFSEGYSVQEISKELCCDESTIVRYLKQLTLENKCAYKTPVEKKQERTLLILNMLNEGKPPNEIAKILGVCKSVIYTTIKELEKDKKIKYMRRQEITSSNKEKAKKLLREGINPYKVSKLLNIDPSLSYQCSKELKDNKDDNEN